MFSEKCLNFEICFFYERTYYVCWFRILVFSFLNINSFRNINTYWKLCLTSVRSVQTFGVFYFKYSQIHSKCSSSELPTWKYWFTYIEHVKKMRYNAEIAIRRGWEENEIYHPMLWAVTKNYIWWNGFIFPSDLICQWFSNLKCTYSHWLVDWIVWVYSGCKLDWISSASCETTGSFYAEIYRIPLF